MPASVPASMPASGPASVPSSGLIVCRRDLGRASKLSNLVYTHPESRFRNEYLKIGPHVFGTATSDLVPKEGIYLNLVQRKMLSLNENDTVIPIPWSPPAEDLALHFLQIEIDLWDPPKGKPEEKVYVPEAKLSQLLRREMAGRLFNQDQTFFFTTNWDGRDGKDAGDSGVGLDVRVRKMERVQVREEPIRTLVPVPVTIGILTENTTIEVSLAKFAKRRIELESVQGRPEFLNPDWQFTSLGIGGLDREFSVIFRRAFLSRCLSPELLKEFNVKHVRGILLYGPPGTGKTLIARQFGKLLKGREPKVVNGPEIINSYVGKSEENIRKLFDEAKAEWKEKKERSSLHVIIFDEIDVICKARGSVTSSGVYDTVVNQLLTEMDGINTPNNFLVIGMTNRKDFLDPALLRPGRFEVHVEVHLPDKRGRADILAIHTKSMRENGRLEPDVDLEELADRTKNFSGAELEGLIGCAKTFALSEAIDGGEGDKVLTELEREDKFNEVTIGMSHFVRALDEVRPSFGAQHEDLELRIPHGVIIFNERMKALYEGCTGVIRRFGESADKDNTCSILLTGVIGCGRSALASKLALESGYPYIKLVLPENFIGYTEQAKSSAIAKVFDDAYKTPLSLVILEDLERLLEYVEIGPRFANQVLQTLSVLINRIHPVPGRRLMIIATTSEPEFLADLKVDQYFTVVHRIPMLETESDRLAVLDGLRRAGETVPDVDDADADVVAGTDILGHNARPVAIKKFLTRLRIRGN